MKALNWQKAFLGYAQYVLGNQPIKPIVEIRLILTDASDVPFTSASELNLPERISSALKAFSNKLAD